MASERYELRPVEDLRRGDLIYMMTHRLQLTADPYRPEEMRRDMRRVPVRRVDDLDNTMAPPFEAGLLMPVLIPEDKADQEGLAVEVRRLAKQVAELTEERDQYRMKLRTLELGVNHLRTAFRELGVWKP
jgi:hypothetical protein